MVGVGLGQLAVEYMLAFAVLALSLDEVAGVEPFGSTNQSGNNLGTESFTITHDGRV